MTADELLIKIAGILNKIKVPYQVTGGFAVTVWGRPRFTADIDVVIELSLSKKEELIKALRFFDKDGYVDEFLIEHAFKTKGEFNYIHSETGVKVDFWIAGQSDYDKEKLKRGRTKKINGQKIVFTSPEDLILAKLKWYKESESERQLEDVQSVLKITKVDIGYLKKWAEHLGVNNILEKIIKD